MSKLAVVAIGGNSLIKDEAHKSVPDQFAAVRETAVHIADMIEQGWNVVITHGNGPQVGFILLRLFRRGYPGGYRLHDSASLAQRIFAPPYPAPVRHSRHPGAGR